MTSLQTKRKMEVSLIEIFARWARFGQAGAEG